MDITESLPTTYPFYSDDEIDDDESDLLHYYYIEYDSTIIPIPSWNQIVIDSIFPSELHMEEELHLLRYYEIIDIIYTFL